MKSDEVSRRFVVGALGVGAATAAAGVAVGSVPARSSALRPASPDGKAPDGAEPVADDEPALAQAARLVAPLAAGDRLGRWTVQQVLPVQDGAASLVLADGRGERFQLDVCARDESNSSPAGPGRSEHFEVFLANSGNGSKATFEDHGLAAMALAEVIRANEQHVDRALFHTQARRLAANNARVFIT